MIRDYALHHLPDMTQEERQIISNTEPTVGQVNYAEVHFKWADIREVLSGAPPKCEPFKVIVARYSK